MITYNEANKLHKDQWYLGKYSKLTKEYVFPYNILHKNDMFIIAEVQIDEIKLQETDETRVNEYKELMLEQDLGLPWLTYGKRLKNEVQQHWHKQFYAVDGNHRLKAMKLLQKHVAKAYIPLTHYKLYERLKT